MSDAQRPAWLDQAVAIKDQKTLPEIAREVNVPLTELIATFRRLGINRRPKKATAQPSAPPAASVRSERASSQPSSRPGSKDAKIERHFALLGKVPDAEIARMANVSVRTVASYRSRNNIAGYKGPRRRPNAPGRRHSRLDEYRPLLGRVPDRVVAEEAGMSLGAVRNYRIKYDISPAGRLKDSTIRHLMQAWRDGEDVESALVELAGGPAEVRAVMASADARPNFDEVVPRGSRAPEPVAAVSIPSSGAKAWKVVMGDTHRVVVADNLLDCAQKLVRAGLDSKVDAIEALGSVIA